MKLLFVPTELLLIDKNVDSIKSIINKTGAEIVLISNPVLFCNELKKIKLKIFDVVNFNTYKTKLSRIYQLIFYYFFIDSYVIIDTETLNNKSFVQLNKDGLITDNNKEEILSILS